MPKPMYFAPAPPKERKADWNDVAKALVGQLGGGLIGAGSSALQALVESAAQERGSIWNATKPDEFIAEFDKRYRAETGGIEADTTLKGSRAGYLDAGAGETRERTKTIAPKAESDLKTAETQRQATAADTQATKTLTTEAPYALHSGRSVRGGSVAIGPDGLAEIDARTKAQMALMKFKRDLAPKPGRRDPEVVVTQDGRVLTVDVWEAENKSGAKTAAGAKSSGVAEAGMQTLGENRPLFVGPLSRAERFVESMPHGPIEPPRDAGEPFSGRGGNDALEATKAYLDSLDGEITRLETEISSRTRGAGISGRPSPEQTDAAEAAKRELKELRGARASVARRLRSMGGIGSTRATLGDEPLPDETATAASPTGEDYATAKARLEDDIRAGRKTREQANAEMQRLFPEM